MLFVNPLDEILGQVSKVKILRFLCSTAIEFNGREISRAVGLSHVKCHTALQELSAHGLVTIRKVGKSFIYSLERENVIYKMLLESLFKNELLLFDNLIEHIVRCFKGTKPITIILFGSIVKGDARPNSDIDILVIVDDKDLIDSQQAIEKAEGKVMEDFGNQLSPVLITQSDFREKYRRGDKMYLEIAKTGKRIYGKSISEII